MKGWHCAPCDGSAHDPDYGGMVDHCMVCAPLWGTVVVPTTCATVEDWRDVYHAAEPRERARLRRAKDRATAVEAARRAADRASRAG